VLRVARQGINLAAAAQNDRIVSGSEAPRTSSPEPQLSALDHALEPLPFVASILDGVRSLIGVRDAAGRYLLVNSAMTEFHGAPAGAFVGRTPAEIGLPEFAFRQMPRRFAPEPAVVRDVPLVDATGHVRLFDVVSRSLPAADPAQALMLEVATEVVTPEAQAAALAAREPAGGDVGERLELVLRNGNLALIDWDIATDRIAASPQLAELLGLDVHAVPATGAELALYEHPRDRPRVQAELAAHLDRKSDEYYCEYRLRTGSGRIRWVIATGRVVERARGGRALKYRGTLQDVTESIETEQELQRQLSRSREATRLSENLMLEVRRLEAEIREVSQREHERIGHDLHDGLGQELTGVSLLLKTLEDAIARDAPQLSTRVHSLRDMVEQSIATARALAQGLSPVHLDRDGFPGALEQLCASSEALYGIPVKFTSRQSHGLPALTAAADLYRIAQEAIRNAARHSGAREIRVLLIADERRVALTIEDDGHGVVPGAETRGGMGMKIMRYRASIIGAALEIGAREQGGTVVRCVLRQTAERDKAGASND
jgi:PAS domain S-box-containing protein